MGPRTLSAGGTAAAPSMPGVNSRLPWPSRLNPRVIILAIAFCSSLSGCIRHEGAASESGLLDDAAGGDWPAVGRTYGEQHFSPLAEINADSVTRLGLAWFFDLPAYQLSTSTPVATGGVLYTATGYSVVRAFDVATGKLLWTYDPQVARVAGERLHAGWGSRGLAYWRGHIFIGTNDGRLISIDAGKGKPVWSQMTLQPGDTRFISSAPRIFKDKVIIGHAGADIGATRGYVTAYDAASGRQLWRFYLVPGNPADGFENEAMKMAAKTWSGDWWKFGGGATAWNAITYDADFNRIYIGAGNAEPWNPRIRSPGGGDNLFTCSIVALDADTGAYAWHYQLNPDEAWDYDAATDMQLATLTIGGKQRKVLLQASKNGFFYIIDRTDGKLISAEKFARVTWAERIDLASGRPVENPHARYENGPVTVLPGPGGAHNWQSMSFNPVTKLVYIPAIELPWVYSDSGIDLIHWQPRPGFVPNTGTDLAAAAHSTVTAENYGSSLLAWDPLRQRPAWTVPTPDLLNGGTLTTAGNLVFQGQGDGKFLAYAAVSGKLLWSFDAGSGIIGTPISFSAGGRQYVSVLSGMGGSSAMPPSKVAQFGLDGLTLPHRVLTFVLSGSARLPPTELRTPVPVSDPSYRADDVSQLAGSKLYTDHCEMCHGREVRSAGRAPDLRASALILSAEALDQVVRKGGLEQLGMPKFGGLTDMEIANLRQYLRSRASEDR